MSADLVCGKPHKEKDWEDHWTEFVISGFPYMIKIHGGHACSTEERDDNWDNVWIEWNGQHVDVPSDERCRVPADEVGMIAVYCYLNL